MASAPFQLQDTNKVPYTVVGVDADGQPTTLLPAGATLAISSANAAVATVVADATAAAGTIASGFIVPASPLVLNTPVQINAAVTNADGSAGVTGSAQVVVVPGAAAKIMLNFGAEVAQ